MEDNLLTNQHSGTQTIMIWLAGLAGCLFVIAAVIAATGLFHQTQSREAYQKQLDANLNAAAQALRKEQEANLDSYRWIDQQSGVVAIPIDRAMLLVAEEWKDN